MVQSKDTGSTFEEEGEGQFWNLPIASEFIAHPLTHSFI